MKQMNGEIKEHKNETMLNRTGDTASAITGMSARYCAVCQRKHSCYIVRWPDGKITKPCTAGVRHNASDILQIGA